MPETYPEVIPRIADQFETLLQTFLLIVFGGFYSLCGFFILWIVWAV